MRSLEKFLMILRVTIEDQMAKRWTDKEKQILITLLEQPNKYTYFDLADVLERPISGVKRVCSDLNLQSNIKKTKSEGEEILFTLLRQVYPKLSIKRQHPVGERLHLDLYIPNLNLGFEFDGIQHMEQSDFFHKNRDAFISGQLLDDKKDNLCANQGIHLIRINHKENLCKSILVEKIKEVGSGPGTEKQTSFLSFKDKVKMYNKYRYESVKDTRDNSNYHKLLKKKGEKFRKERYLYLKRIKEENDKELQ